MNLIQGCKIMLPGCCEFIILDGEEWIPYTVLMKVMMMTMSKRRRTVTVTVTEALSLRPLLVDRGRIAESIRILVPVDRMKQKWRRRRM